MIERIDDVKSGAERGAQSGLDGTWQLSSWELLRRIYLVEEAVVRGTAQMSDYEAFVRCQEELARREVHHSR